MYFQLNMISYGIGWHPTQDELFAYFNPKPYTYEREHDYPSNYLYLNGIPRNERLDLILPDDLVLLKLKVFDISRPRKHYSNRHKRKCYKINVRMRKSMLLA